MKIADEVKKMITDKVGDLLKNIDKNPSDEKEEDKVDVKDMDRAGLKKFIKDNKLEVVVYKKMSDDDIRQAITKAQTKEPDEKDEEEVEEETPATEKLTPEQYAEKAYQSFKEKVEKDEIKKQPLDVVLKSVLKDAGVDLDEDVEIVFKDKKKGIELDTTGKFRKNVDGSDDDREYDKPGKLDAELDELEPEERKKALNHFFYSVISSK